MPLARMMLDARIRLSSWSRLLGVSYLVKYVGCSLAVSTANEMLRMSLVFRVQQRRS